MLHYVLCLVTQSCQILCSPMDCSLPGSSVHGDSPGKNTGMGCHALLQGIFPTQGSNPCLLQCRSHRRCGFSPWIWKIPWRRAWQPNPVFLPGESPWSEEPGRLPSMGSQSDTTKHSTLDVIEPRCLG